jgi:hypothetical protein
MDFVLKIWLQQKGVVTITHTITSVTHAWFFHVLNLI